MRSEVGEWLATCVGSPISVLLLCWSLLIYQNQPLPTKRRIDVLTVAVLAQSLVHQLGLLLFAMLTLIRPANHFGELCSTLVWTLNSSSILQELTLTTIAIFAALTVRDEGPTIKKHHLKYHVVSLTVISACIGVTGILNFEPEACVFIAQDISPKYGLFFNGLRCALVVATVLSLLAALCRASCRPSPKAELLKSVSDLSDASSKNSFECQHPHHHHHQHHYGNQLQQQQQAWDQPSSGSCTSGSTNSRACLKGRRSSVVQVDESSGWSTVYSILFVCYAFDHLPLLVVSIRPDLLRDFCTAQNLATWLPLLKDTLLPVFLAIFDKMFCRYVAKVYTKQDTKTRLTHGGVDGKFRHFEQDNEYKLQLNLNHGLKFPVNGAGSASLYGRLHNSHPTTRGRNGTMLLGVHQYGRSVMSSGDSAYPAIAAETSSYASSNFGSRQHLEPGKSPKMHHQPIVRADLSRANSTSNGQCVQRHHELGYDLRRKAANGSGDVFGQKVESLMQLEDQSYGYGARRLRHFAKSLDEIREETPRRNARSVMGHHEDRAYNPPPGVLQVRAARPNAAALRRNQSFDLHPRAYPRIELPLVTSRTYDVKRELALKRSLQLFEQTRRSDEYEEDEEGEGTGYETSDDESCDVNSDQQDFDTMSSCRSRARSCCSVTTVANDDFEFFQRKNTKELQSQTPRPLEGKGSMRSFTPRIIEVNHSEMGANSADHSKTRGNCKPIIQSFQLKKKMSPGYSLNDLDKFNNAAQARQQLPTLSIESLKSILKSSDVSYLDSGEICRHDLGGSAPDFKKIFVTEFI
ncbi:uncharacterized protein LOC131674704 [Phymastichus coffea]|uniref:uncharacterized protein LOC131674704 n=1 Tax=Phymastichus coffea TaxID=108790 RepID=UPI00273AF13A|nr:uncharacterized protein LOC131674704 [Phymastichus coffea]